MTQLHAEALQTVAETTASVACAEQWDKAVQAIETGQAVAFRYGQGVKVAINSATSTVMYRWDAGNEHCPCKADQADRLGWPRVAADILTVNLMLTEQANAAKRAAAKAQPARISVAVSVNPLDELFN